MKKLIKLIDAKGKSFTDFAFSPISGQAILVFGDEFCCLGINQHWDRCDNEIEEQGFDVFSFEDEKLIELEIYQKEELERLHRKHDEAFLRQQEESDRLQYEKLKKKFG